MGKKKTNTTASSTTVVEDSRHKKEDGESEVLLEKREEFLLENRTFDPSTPPIQVGLTMGITKNLGDYQSARMDIHINASCLPEEMEVYLERMKTWVGRRLGREIREIDERFVESEGRRRR